jgi:6,7-dimethyl-8-ribityllumazine synthase
MSSSLKNLSEYNSANMPEKRVIEQQQYAVVVSDWNFEITDALCGGAVSTLLQNGVKQENIVVVNVPGTFELTYASAVLQQTENFAAIIAIGCVVRGETPHFDYICQGVSHGISLLNANGTTPIIFSVLTVDSQEQALERAGGKHGNKGVEGAITAIKMGNLAV